MSIGARHLRDLLRGLTSESPEVRSGACDTVADWAQFLNGPEGAVASYTVGCLAMIETEPDCLEAEMHALATLAEWELAPSFVYDEVKHLDPGKLGAATRTHYDNFIARMALDLEPFPDHRMDLLDRVVHGADRGIDP
ncbi:MAG: hypothetical protein L0Y54_12745 [Sporichthyaceae bacterium]|nr:hypothetical protein [Sporichthyaceae bacterium]